MGVGVRGGAAELVGWVQQGLSCPPSLTSSHPPTHLACSHLGIPQRQVQQVCHAGAHSALVPSRASHRQNEFHQLGDEGLKVDSAAICVEGRGAAGGGVGGGERRTQLCHLETSAPI